MPLLIAPSASTLSVYRALLLAILLGTTPAWAAPAALHPDLTFEENRGQFAPELAFVGRTDAFSVALSPSQGGLVFRRGEEAPLVLRLAGVSGRAERPRGEQRAPGSVSYFIGNDPSRWRTHVPTYGRIRWPGVYPGVDLIVRGDPKQLEVDFEVAPGASTRAIEWVASAGASLRHESDGTLHLRSPSLALVVKAPRSWETAGGERVALRSEYESRGGARVGFRVQGHRQERALVIDPTIVTSGYLGGSTGEGISAVALDTSGNLYVVGSTSSSDFPVTNGSTLNGTSTAVFVSELDPTGQTLLFSSYFGGTTSFSEGTGMAVAADGSILVGGWTQSTTFPTVAAAQPTSGGEQEAFVFKLAPGGSSVVYSTYLGGAASDMVAGVAVDPAGNAFVTGTTYSNDFPVLNAAQASLGSGANGTADAFVTKLSSAGSFSYSTFLGGSIYDFGNALQAGSDGSVFVVGQTDSSNFPVTAASQSAFGGGNYDAFVTHLSPAGAFVFSTYLGGSQVDIAEGVAVTPTGDGYVVGFTQSSDFPALGQALAPFSATSGFLTRVSAEGTWLQSTFIPGDQPASAAADPLGGVYWAGSTNSQDLTTVAPTQSAFGGGADAVVGHYSALHDALDFVTYLGGSAFDEAIGITAQASGKVLVGGLSQSTDFPVVNAFQATSHTGSSTGVLTLISMPPLARSLAPPTGPSTGGTTVTVSGMSFQAGDVLTFDGVEATDNVSTDGLHVSATTPPHAAGPVDVAVVRGSITSTLTGAFEYVAAPSGTGPPPVATPPIPVVPGAPARRGPLAVAWNCQSGTGGPSVLALLGWVLVWRVKRSRRPGRNR